MHGGLITYNGSVPMSNFRNFVELAAISRMAFTYQSMKRQTSKLLHYHEQHLYLITCQVGVIQDHLPKRGGSFYDQLFISHYEIFYYFDHLQ